MDEGSRSESTSYFEEGGLKQICFKSIVIQMVMHYFLPLRYGSGF